MIATSNKCPYCKGRVSPLDKQFTNQHVTPCKHCGHLIFVRRITPAALACCQMNRDDFLAAIKHFPDQVLARTQIHEAQERVHHDLGQWG